MDETAAAALFGYAWPLDLAELEDCVAAALATTTGMRTSCAAASPGSTSRRIAAVRSSPDRVAAL